MEPRGVEPLAFTRPKKPNPERAEVDVPLPSLAEVPILVRVLRTVRSLRTSLDERDGILVRPPDLRLNLLARASSGVPSHRQVRVELGLELPGWYAPLCRAVDVEPFATGQEHGVGVLLDPAAGHAISDGPDTDGRKIVGAWGCRARRPPEAAWSSSSRNDAGNSLVPQSQPL